MSPLDGPTIVDGGGELAEAPGLVTQHVGAVAYTAQRFLALPSTQSMVLFPMLCDQSSDLPFSVTLHLKKEL